MCYLWPVAEVESKSGPVEIVTNRGGCRREMWVVLSWVETSTGPRRWKYMNGFEITSTTYNKKTALDHPVSTRLCEAPAPVSRSIARHCSAIQTLSIHIARPEQEQEEGVEHDASIPSRSRPMMMMTRRGSGKSTEPACLVSRVTSGCGGTTTTPQTSVAITDLHEKRDQILIEVRARGGGACCVSAPERYSPSLGVSRTQRLSHHGT